MLTKVKKLIKQSEIVLFSQQLAQKKIPSYKYRSLTESEITALEKNLNSCDDWTRIQVEISFTPDNIRNNVFCGSLFLPHFFGRLMTPGGVAVPAGIYNSSINDSIIENSHIFNVSTLSNTIVSHSVLLRNVGSIVGSGKTHFGIGRSLKIGDETGNRTILSFPEIELPIATEILMGKENEALREKYNALIEEYRDSCVSSYTYIAQEAIIANTANIRNVWIGRSARIDGAIRIKNSVLLSSREQMTAVYDGAIVENSVLQWGSEIGSLSIVDHSIMLEESGASKHAKITHSLIGSNTHPESGEITSSLVGPFVGMHHQSLLISALWPAGCGNIGYGANVGSNHTGRLPDQEIRPGQGMFFGLSSVIKFPADFSESPWSLIATGVATQPQQLRFPFALLVSSQSHVPHHLQHLTEIIPGWVYESNAFSLARNNMKFEQRNKSRRNSFSCSFMSTQTAELVIGAWHRLFKPARIKEFYTAADIEGLGACVLSESNRQRALRSYADFLERFALTHVVELLEQKPELLASETPIVKRLFHSETMKEITRIVTFPASTILMLKRFRKIENQWVESIKSSIKKDADRGTPIFEDYARNHPADEKSLLFVQNIFDSNRKRVSELMTQAKN